MILFEKFESAINIVDGAITVLKIAASGSEIEAFLISVRML